MQAMPRPGRHQQDGRDDDEASLAVALAESVAQAEVDGIGGPFHLAASPPSEGISFSSMARLGFAATGPALGSSPGVFPPPVAVHTRSHPPDRDASLSPQKAYAPPPRIKYVLAHRKLYSDRAVLGGLGYAKPALCPKARMPPSENGFNPAFEFFSQSGCACGAGSAPRSPAAAGVWSTAAGAAKKWGPGLGASGTASGETVLPAQWGTPIGSAAAAAAAGEGRDSALPPRPLADGKKGKKGKQVLLFSSGQRQY